MRLSPVVLVSCVFLTTTACTEAPQRVPSDEGPVGQSDAGDNAPATKRDAANVPENKLDSGSVENLDSGSVEKLDTAPVADAAPPPKDATVQADAAAGASDAAAPDAGAAAAPTFTQLYDTIFGVKQAASASSCWGSSCHGAWDSGRGPAHRIDFTTKQKAWDTLVSERMFAPNKVTTTPSSSELYTKLNTGAMPKGRPKLSAALLDSVRRWLAAGAKND